MRRSWLFAGALGALALLLPAPAARSDPTTATKALDFRRIIQDAKERVFPAVVYIRCTRRTTEEGKDRFQQVSGSGVLISSDGSLLTNWHVVDKAEQLRCLLYNGEARAATIVGTDKDTDLALCRLERKAEDESFPHAILGDSEGLTEGDFVMAMGAPWGLSRSVSLGIVSCTRRYLEEHSEYSLWLQTDAAISPGNSGGPLVDTKGTVIGINTRGVMSGGDMGFAIPVETVRRVVDQLQAHGKVKWSWTGLQLSPLNDFERDIYFGGKEGVIVSGTDPEGPARRAGLRPQDRILSIGGRPVRGTTSEDLPAIRRMLGFLEQDAPARLVVQRGSEMLEMEVVPREKGAVEGKELACPRWDFSVKAINQFDNPQLYFHRKQGLFVYGVKDPGNADTAGLQRGDILLKVGSTKVTTLEELKAVHTEAVENVAARHKLTLTVLRNGLLRQIVLDYSRNFDRE